MKYVGLKERGILDIALMPSGSVLAATDQGVWIAASDGRSVTPMTVKGLPRPADKCFIHQVVSDSKGNVYIAAGTVPGDPGMGGDGVFRLSAGGGTWESIGRKQLFMGLKNERIGSLAVMPDDTLFCTVNTKSIYAGESRVTRLHRSMDGGTTWTNVSPDPGGGIHGGPMAAGPNRQVWEVVGEKPYYGAARWIMKGSDWKAAKIQWVWNTIQPRSPSGQIVNEHAISRLALDSKGIAYVLANSGKPPFPAGVYRSRDGGATWQNVADTQEMHALVVTPDDHVYYGTYGGIQRSIDGGATWTNYTTMGKTFVSDLLIDGQGRLWASGDGQGKLLPNYGLFQSVQPVSRALKTARSGAPAAKGN